MEINNPRDEIKRNCRVDERERLDLRSLGVDEKKKKKVKGWERKKEIKKKETW